MGIKTFLLLGLTVLALVLPVSDAWWSSTNNRKKSSKGQQIADKARQYIGSHNWLKSSDHEVADSGDNKCNLFVADVLREVHADAPNRHWWYSPIGAWEWANSESDYLKDDRCWILCHSLAKGDVIASGGHVGIVTGSALTTSASAVASPPGKIVENNWGFRGENPLTCWRYSC